MVKELVRFQVGPYHVRLTAPAGHQIMINHEWQDIHHLELKKILGDLSWSAMTRAVLTAVELNPNNPDKITQHFLSIIRGPIYRDLGFWDVSSLN